MQRKIVLFLFCLLVVFVANQTVINPSFSQGFARTPAEAKPEYANRWEGLVAGWDTSLGVTGGTFYDISHYKSDGTLNNMDLAADWIISGGGTTTDINYVLDITGTGDDRIQVSNNGVGWAENRPAATIIIWVKVKTIANFDAVIGQGAFGSDYLYLYQSSNAWAVAIRSTNGATGGDRFSVISSTLGYLTTPDDTFHQVVITVQMGGVGGFIYSDMVQIGSDAITTGLADFSGGGDLFFGSFSGGNGGDYEITQVLIYNKRLSLSEIKDNYDDRYAMFELRPLVYKTPAVAAPTLIQQIIIY